MPYTLERTSSAGTVVGTAHSLKEAFIEGARGVFSMCYDIDRLKGNDSVEVIAQASSKEELFAAWIQELLDRATASEAAMVDFDVHAIQSVNETGWLLTGTAWMCSLADAKSVATGTFVNSIKKGSATVVESGDICSCTITVTTSA